jgi:quercetin dioxygenase-like cupin family protein
MASRPLDFGQGARVAGSERIDVFNLEREQEWNPKRHVEKILGEVGAGDVTVACWEPGQISPYHCHPHATEIYFCYQGGGRMRTPRETIDVTPGSFVVHPAGELHEYINGPNRTPVPVRYGTDMSSRHFEWRGNGEWTQSREDAEYFQQHPPR